VYQEKRRKIGTPFFGDLHKTFNSLFEKLLLPQIYDWFLGARHLKRHTKATVAEK